MVSMTRAVFDGITSHALEHPSEMVCGILGGRQGTAECVYCGTNVAENRRTRFTMDPHDILKISDEIAASGQELLGFYHSYTDIRAYPSPTTVADWPAGWYPDAVCFICSLV